VGSAEKYQFWLQLRRLKTEWDRDVQIAVSFEEYVRATAGIEMTYVDGNIGSVYRIVDEQQHMLFKLKYT
jgi:hypothetical protein